VSEASAINMAEVLHCSAFEVMELDVEDYLRWERTAAEHSRRQREEIDKCRT